MASFAFANALLHRARILAPSSQADAALLKENTSGDAVDLQTFDCRVGCLKRCQHA